MKRRFDLGVRHLVAAGLLVFVLGAFVVASLGTMSWRAPGAQIGAKSNAPAGGVDEAPRAGLQAPAPTSGRTRVISTHAPQTRGLPSPHLTPPGGGIPPPKPVSTFP